MRKVLWASLAGGVVMLGGVGTVAHFAARNPDSLAGRAVLSAGRIVIGASPIAPLASTLSHLEKSHAKPVLHDAPAGVEEPAEPVEMPEPRGAIVIPDNEPVCPHAEIEPAVDHLLQITRDDAHEDASPECPLTMPLCDEEQGEKLGMPCSEADEEEQEEAGTGSTGAVEKLFRLFEKAVKKSEEGRIDPAPMPECREDPHHHYHHSGCPYTGRGSMHCPAGSYRPSVPAMPPAPMTQPGAEESHEPGKPEQHSSALQKIRRFSTRIGEDADATRVEVDTMEYRTADGQLYDFGHGAM